MSGTRRAAARSTAERQPRYAKLAHPRLFSAVLRPRLFARIEALRRGHSVVWIASPPGAGKTTLVASYLNASKAPSIWYQVDEGDADPASFFFFLAQAMRQPGPALPWLAPELTEDIPRFARLFFRKYWARLPVGGVVVFDNIQDFDWDRWGQLLEIAFAEVPEGVTVVAISRDAPPARLARLELSGAIATLGWSELRLDAQEARQLAQLDDGTDASGRAWLAKIDGWAAGVVMLREHMAKPSPAAAMSEPNLLDGQEAVFRYFAGEILERMPPAWQRLLLLLSCLPGISAADAQELTGDPAAARLLGQLFHHRLFLDRRGPAPFTYHFHALFREFLQYEADRRLEAGERAALLERAAAILQARGRIDEAARLYHDAGAYPQLVRLLLASAGSMLATGRGQTWREWLGWIPAAVAGREPRLRYWEGASLNQVDPVRAREVLAAAERVFIADGDVLHRLLAIAAIVESCFYEWADFQSLPTWIARMDEALRELAPEALAPDAALQIHSRLVLALSIAEPDSPLLQASVQHALLALPRVSSAADRLIAGAFLMIYLNWGDLPAARDLSVALAPLVDDPAIAPFHRISWCRSVIYRLQFDGDIPAAQALVEKAQRLAAEYGLEQMQFQLHFRSALNLLSTGEAAQALEPLARMRGMLSPSRKLELVYVRILETSYLARTGAMAQARQAADDAVRLGAEARLTATTRWQITMLLAYCHALCGDLDESREWSQRAIAAAYGPEQDSAREEARFLAAYVHMAAGQDSEAVAILQDLLRHQRERGASFPMLLRLVPGVAEATLSLALREGIEVEHVRRTIAAHAFSPPDGVSPDWPWPLAVRALGRLELSVRGEPVRSAGKAQKRPLALLKALVAAGEAGKAQGALTRQLWPDGEESRSALNVTIHRLRKLLGDDAAVTVVSGTVALDGKRVWTDVRALADLCSRVDALPAGETTPESLRRLAQALLDLYRGPFCADDEDPWLVAPREAWRRRFLAAVLRLGEGLEQARDWTAAQHVYTGALEAEPLAETGYRGLMRCAHARHDPAAAFGAYRRCRDILSVVLGRAPSAETEALAIALGLKTLQAA